MQILRIKGLDPYYNLALEEYILRNRTDDDYLLLWQNQNTIVVGCHQNTIEEINSAFVREKDINVVRRITGGGAVYHDRGNLNFSFITAAEDAAQITMRLFTEPIAAFLRELGVPAEVSGRNDITANGLKVSGNAQHLYKNRLLHHGTLLFEANLEVVTQALRVNPVKLQSKSIKSVRGRVGNIRDFLAVAISTHEFAELLVNWLVEGKDYSEFVLSAEEEQAVEELRAEKYLSWEWNYGKSPAFNLRELKKFDGGILEVGLNVEKGLIKDCVFYGDFMSLRPALEVSEKLCGCRYSRADVNAVLDKLPLEEYFGSINLDEILQCIFAIEAPE